MQLEDLRRHGESKLHLDALQKRQAAASGSVYVQPERDNSIPTSAQLHRAVECLKKQTRAGQGCLYETSCRQSRVSDPFNFPEGRSTAKEGMKLTRASAAVEQDKDRQLLREALAAGWAEAACQHGARGFKAVSLTRV